MDAYLLKRKLLRPYAAVMKRLLARANPGMQQAMAVHNYGPAFLRFILRYVRNPDVLCRASVANVRTILDVGAFDGSWAARAEELTGATVYSFEPDPSILRVARRKLGGRSNVRLFDFGLSDVDEQVQLLQKGPGSTACVEAAARLSSETTSQRGVMVRMRDVKDLFDELGLEQVDFLKINIEGGEYRLLDRLIQTGYVARCRCLMVQFHEWYPDAYAYRRRIHRALKQTHRLDWSDYFVWERWTRKTEPRKASQS